MRRSAWRTSPLTRRRSDLSRAARGLLGGLGLVLSGCGSDEPAHAGGCSVASLADGSAEIECADGTRVNLPVPQANAPSATDPDATSSSSTGGSAGAGPAGPRGINGTSCTLVTEGGNTRVRCSDGTEAIITPPPVARRHVILMIGDGMGQPHQVAASRYRYGTDFGLSFQTFPSHAFVTTFSVTAYDAYAAERAVAPYSRLNYETSVGYDPARGGFAPYPYLPETPAERDYFVPGGVSAPCTDSAAAATAMSTGYKTSNAVLGLLPTGTPVETSAERLRRLYGMAMGVVTTVPMSHATPAGFVSHQPSRYNYLDIAHEMATETVPDVVIGGGYRGTAVDYISEEDVNAIKSSPDYVYVERQDNVDGGESLLAAAAQAAREKKKLWALYGAENGNFVSPLPVDAPGAPALNRVSTRDPTLSQATTAALEVLSQDPQGLFLMVEQGTIDQASHANDFVTMIGCTLELDDAVKAAVDFVNRPDDAMDWTNTTLMVVADHATGYLRLGSVPLPMGSLPPAITAAGEDAAYSWGSDYHTNELISLYAMGAQAHRVATYANRYPGHPIIDNTDIYRLTLDASTR